VYAQIGVLEAPQEPVEVDTSQQLREADALVQLIDFDLPLTRLLDMRDFPISRRFTVTSTFGASCTHTVHEQFSSQTG